MSKLPADYHIQDGCWNCQRCFRPWNPECFEGYCVADAYHGVRYAARLHRQYLDGLSFTRCPVFSKTRRGEWTDAQMKQALAWRTKETRPYNDWSRFRDVEAMGRCSRWRQSQAGGMKCKTLKEESDEVS